MPTLQQQMQRDPIAPVVLREDRLFLILGERLPVNASLLGGRIARAGSPCRR
jgi:hypothetical protein